MMIFLAFLGHGGQSNFRKLIQGIMRAQKHFGRVRICKENGISDRISTLDNLVEIEVPKIRWDSKRATNVLFHEISENSIKNHSEQYLISNLDISLCNIRTKEAIFISA